MQKAVKIVLINIVIFGLLFMGTELGVRVAWTVRSCLTSRCDFGKMQSIKLRDLGENFGVEYVGISRLDDNLGHVPREGFDGVLNFLEGATAKVTITKDGFRLNNPGMNLPPADILVVGDSFAFGDAVSNEETWVACLERKLERGVDNGGVFGYGAAQALRRASLLLPRKAYSTLIQSILVGEDFDRDRLSYRWGFAKPALIRTQTGIEWSAVSDPYQPGTRYNPAREKRPLAYLYERFLIVAFLVDRLMPGYDFVRNRLTMEHPDAADKEAIIEWTLQQLASLELNKIVLLQYLQNVDDPKVVKERDLILKISSDLSLKVVDSLDVLATYDRNKLWVAHHTAFGNELVCDYLYEEAFLAGEEEGASM